MGAAWLPALLFLLRGTRVRRTSANKPLTCVEWTALGLLGGIILVGLVVQARSVWDVVAAAGVGCSGVAVLRLWELTWRPAEKRGNWLPVWLAAVGGVALLGVAWLCRR